MLYWNVSDTSLTQTDHTNKTSSFGEIIKFKRKDNDDIQLHAAAKQL